MDEKLTRKSQEALSEAVKHAAVAGNPNVDGLHLLAALLQQEGGTADPLLRAVGADPAALLTAVSDRLARLLLAALATAGKRAQEMQDEYVSTEHLLVGLAADGGEAATLLRQAGAGPQQL